MVIPEVFHFRRYCLISSFTEDTDFNDLLTRQYEGVTLSQQQLFAHIFSI